LFLVFIGDMVEMKQIIVMRKDLNMRKGKAVAQGAHASMKATLENQTDPRVVEWLDGKFTKICVTVQSGEELFEVYEKAQAAGLITALILDAGLTEFKEPTHTCIAVGPDTPENLQPVTGDLKLY
jgi:PTH2 family peptidyl-tRNA hydrolase